VRYKNDAEVKLPRPIWHYLFVAIALLLLAEVLVAAYKRKEKDA